MVLRVIAVFVLLAASVPCWCQDSEGPVPESQKLKDLEDEFWTWRMKDAPLFSTVVGETEHNDALESFLYPVYAQRKSEVASYLARVQTIQREQLTADEQLDYDIFTDYLQTFIDGARWNEYFPVNPVNFLEGLTSDPSRMHTIMPFSTVGDFENYLQRLSRLPQQIDQLIDLMKIAVSTGHTLNNVSVAAVPGQIDSLVGKTVEESEFYVPFTTTLSDSHVVMNKRASLRTRAQTAVGSIQEGLRRLKNYLQQSYMPATRATWGVSGWPDGGQMYQQCLKYHTSTDMTPQQVHDLGLTEVARIQTNMHAALNRLQYRGTIKEFYDSLRSDPRFHKNSSEALLDTYKDYIYNRIFPKINSIFSDIPSLPLKVEAMPYDGPGGVYLAGTPDGSVPGIFYANVMHPTEHSTIDIMSLVMHETVPGHHLQNVYALTSTIPKYRAFVEDDYYYRMPATFPINTAYMEGWALYSEFLGEELGLYSDDYMLMGRYSEEIFRACRLVVDTGLHYFGWERERAIEYMLNNTATSRGEVTTEIDRYLTWPGQATAYKIGEIKIKQLRQKATNALGAQFHLADFHNVLLKNGGMPLHLLERLVDQWIADMTGSHGPTSVPGNSDSLVG